ncbi:MAG: hypothetical protein M1826_003021 [Phylliscum demangeonii]|nr:MAG: hypothetical protein M1826_003021 [Phylliscum demangeonii]
MSVRMAAVAWPADVEVRGPAPLFRPSPAVDRLSGRAYGARVPGGGRRAAAPPRRTRRRLTDGRAGPAPATTAPARASLLGLPAEVRLMIYELLLVKDHALRPLCSEARYMETAASARPPGLGPVIALLRVCQRVHAEASHVLYARNTFLLYALDFGDAVLAFLERVGRRNRWAMRSLQLDWQHGIHQIYRTGRAQDLFAMVSDRNNPLRKDLAKMLHDLGRTAVAKFVAAVNLLVDSPGLEHLVLGCPGPENPGHADCQCVEYPGCAGCHRQLPAVLRRIRGLTSLTVGDTDWHQELEAVALEIGVRELNITQVDCTRLPLETVAALEQRGWTIAVTWQDPDGDDFRRLLTKRFPAVADRWKQGGKRKHSW